MKSWARYFAIQAEEIAASKALGLFGIFLGLIHVLTYTKWATVSTQMFLAADNLEIYCKPFLPGCEKFRFLDQDGIAWLMRVYLGIALVVIGLFAAARARAGYFMLVAAHAVKWYLFSLDVRMMGNYHTMALWSEFAFLFLPNKIATIRVLIVIFYLAAGSIKLNVEWLSGSALYNGLAETAWTARLRQHTNLLEVLCAYAVVLELVIAPGLLARNRWLFAATFAQLLLFHAFSWAIVGYFYPCVMGCLLTIHFLSRRFEGEAGLAPLSMAFGSGRRPASIAFLALFAGAMAIPKLIPGDSALTKEGRSFALNMYDAYTYCYSSTIARFKNRLVELSLESREFWRSPRFHCDPYLYFSRARSFCPYFRDDPDFLEIDLMMISKLSSDAQFRPLLRIRDLCGSGLDYRSWRANTWIIK